MSIDSHIEDAMKHLGKKYGGDGPDSRDIFRSVIGSAIDEATAPLRQRIAELEGLGPLIRQFGRINARQDFDHASKVATHIDAILKGGAK